MTADEALADIAAAGWLVNSLYQISPNQWRCNLYRGDIGSRYWLTAGAYGPTAAIALEEAYHNFATAVEHTAQPTCLHQPAPPIDLAKAMAGLFQPAQTVKRII
jgi:hypothetical protein